jgi:hypothetical protein
METTVVYCNAWGLANRGQLGCTYHSLKTLNTIKIPNVQDGSGYFEAACGENHTLLLTD